MAPSPRFSGLCPLRTPSLFTCSSLALATSEGQQDTTMSSVCFLPEKVSGPMGLSTLCTISVNAFANTVPFKNWVFYAASPGAKSHTHSSLGNGPPSQPADGQGLHVLEASLCGSRIYLPHLSSSRDPNKRHLSQCWFASLRPRLSNAARESGLFPAWTFSVSLM